MIRTKILTTLCLIMVVGVAQAGHGGRDAKRMRSMMEDPGGNVERMVEHLSRAAEELDIDDEQLEQIFAVVDAARPDMRDLKMQMHDNKKALREAADPEQYNADSVAALAATQGELTTQMIVLGSRLRADVASILTAEQRGKIKEFRKDRRGNRGRR
jgi:Spy/CpxP family protein refolding chaperone